MRVAGPTTLSTGSSGAASGDHWCRGGGGTEMGGATEWVERYCGSGHPSVLSALRGDARLEELCVCFLELCGLVR